MKKRERPSEEHENWGAPETEAPEGEAPETSLAHPEEKAERESELAERREELAELAEEGVEEKPSSATTQRIAVQRYIEKNLPEYLQGNERVLSRAARKISQWWTKLRGVEVSGKEHIPDDEPVLFVGNHPEKNGPTMDAIGALAERRVHIAIAQRVHWENKLLQPFLKRLGYIPVAESLANRTPQEQAEIIARQPRVAKKTYREIQQHPPTREQITTFVRESVAALLSGGDMLVFPEGLWEMDPEARYSLRQGKRGYELIAKEYQRQTGKPLQIQPFSRSSGEDGGRTQVQFGEAFTLEDIPDDMDAATYAMVRIGQMMPENFRGEYAEAVSRLETKGNE